LPSRVFGALSKSGGKPGEKKKSRVQKFSMIGGHDTSYSHQRGEDLIGSPASPIGIAGGGGGRKKRAAAQKELKMSIWKVPHLPLNEVVGISI